MEIRLLTVQDAQLYRIIRLEMLQDSPSAFGDSYEQNLEHGMEFFEDRLKNTSIYGAFVRGSLVATAGSFITSALKTKHKAALWGVYVQPEYRGQDISLLLSKTVIEALPETITLVQLNVTTGNEAAHKVYTKLGFQEWGVEEKALKVKEQYFNELHMVKFLK